MACLVKMKTLKSSSEEESFRGKKKHIKGPIWLQVKVSELWLFTGSHWPNSTIQI